MPSASGGSRYRALSEVQYLMSAFGGPSVLLGFYDCRYGVTLNTGKVSTVDDARGPSGFGPQLVAVGSTLPTIDASLGGVGITTDGIASTGNGLATATDTKWSLDTVKWIAYIGSVSAAEFTAIIEDGSAGNYLGISGFSSTIKCDYGLANSAPQSALTAASSTQRLIIASSGNAGGSIEVGGRLKVSENRIASNLPSSATNKRLAVGMRIDTSAARCITTCRAIFVGAGEITRAQILALKWYASKYHTATVFDTSKNAILFDGDSLTFGVPTGLSAAYPVAVMAQAGMSGYDYQNLGIGGQYLATIGTNAPAKIDTQGGTFRTKDLYVLWAGTNDVVDLGTTDVQIIALLKAQLIARRAAGFKTALIPPIPRGDAACTSTKLGYLKSVSDWCAASGASYADVVVPLYNHPSYNTWTFGASSAENASVYRADKIHLLDASYSDIGTNATYGVYPALAPIR